MNWIKHYIGGEFIESPKTLKNINPATKQLLGEIHQAGETEVNMAIEAAEQAFPFWSQLSFEQRSSYLNKMAHEIEKRLDDFAAAETKDTGKPISTSFSVDIPRSIKNLRFYANSLNYHKEAFYNSPDQAYNLTLSEPLGIVACISPWNLPLYLFTWKIAPALITGNTVIAKPSEMTPITAFMLSEICQKINLPPGVLNILHGKGDQIGKYLNTHPQIRAISFTGSTRVGKQIAKEASSNLTKVALEMGGKNATVIFNDCDIERACKEAVRAAFSNQGQICLCGSRILIQDEIYDKAIKIIVKETKKLKPGNPLEEKTNFGSLVSEAHFEKILDFLNYAKEKKYKILTGGEEIQVENCDGYFIPPTLIEDVPMECKLNQEEIFGPVATISSFTDDEDALNSINNSSYGLSCSLWSNNHQRNLKLAEAIETGMIWFNTWMHRDLRTTFGGLKNSGFNKEGLEDSFKFFTRTKNICFKY
ncbi:aldehyde dehydrogenase [Bacteriovoracaceae bacterium]|nr:aldehyde dehydrogenase [Bacteriovoracaceae bacterium]